MIMTLEFVFDHLDSAFDGDLQAALNFLSIISPDGVTTQRQAEAQRLEASHDTHLDLSETGRARDCNHLRMLLETKGENHVKKTGI